MRCVVRLGEARVSAASPRKSVLSHSFSVDQVKQFRLNYVFPYTNRQAPKCFLVENVLRPKQAKLQFVSKISVTFKLHIENM